MQLYCSGLPRQRVQMQRHRHQHALVEIAHRGHEDRPPRQAGIGLQFRHMLVLEPETIEFERRCRAAFEIGDHRLAATRIAADGVDADRVVRRYQTHLDQRPQQRDAAGRIAAGIGDARGVGDRYSLSRRHFRKPVDPAGRDPVRRGGIEYLGAIGAKPVDERHRLLGGGVGQAEDDEVDFPQQRLLGGRILAQFRRQTLEHDTVEARESLADTKTGRACLAVDEDRFGGGRRRRRHLRDRRHGRLPQCSAITIVGR